jgi:hypothetical protein
MNHSADERWVLAPIRFHNVQTLILHLRPSGRILLPRQSSPQGQSHKGRIFRPSMNNPPTVAAGIAPMLDRPRWSFPIKLSRFINVRV